MKEQLTSTLFKEYYCGIQSYPAVIRTDNHAHEIKILIDGASDRMIREGRTSDADIAEAREGICMIRMAMAVSYSANSRYTAHELCLRAISHFTVLWPFV